MDIAQIDEHLDYLKKTFAKCEIIYIKTDVSDKKQLEDAYKSIITKFGIIDIVVNSAGIFNDHKIEETLNVNIVSFVIFKIFHIFFSSISFTIYLFSKQYIQGGVINSSLIALNHMSIENGGKGGLIVNVSSIAGLSNVFYSPVYTASKHAIIAFTSSMAVSRFF